MILTSARSFEWFGSSAAVTVDQATGTAAEEPSLSQEELSAAFGRAVTDRLMRRFGVVPLAAAAPSASPAAMKVDSSPSAAGGEIVESRLQLLDQRVAAVDERLASLCAGQEQLTIAVANIAAQLQLLSTPATVDAREVAVKVLGAASPVLTPQHSEHTGEQ